MDGQEVIYKPHYQFKDLQLQATKLEMLFVKVTLVLIQILPLSTLDSICHSWINHPLKHGAFGTGIKQIEVNGISGDTSIIIIEEEPGFGSIIREMEIVEIDLHRFITLC